MSRPITFRLVWAYYIAIPLFLIMEHLWGISFRVPPLSSMPLRYLYYAGCFGCGAVCFIRPRFTSVIGLIESTINIMLIIFLWRAAINVGVRNFAQTGIIPEQLTPKGILGFAVIAAIWTISFYHNRSLVHKMIREKKEKTKSTYLHGPR